VRLLTKAGCGRTAVLFLTQDDVMDQIITGYAHMLGVGPFPGVGHRCRPPAALLTPNRVTRLGLHGRFRGSTRPSVRDRPPNVRFASPLAELARRSAEAKNVLGGTSVALTGQRAGRRRTARHTGGWSGTWRGSGRMVGCTRPAGPLLPGRHAYIESRLPAWSPPGLAVLTHEKQETPQPWPSRFV